MGFFKPETNDFRILLGTPEEGTNFFRLSLAFDEYKDFDIYGPMIRTLNSVHGIRWTTAEKLAKSVIDDMPSQDLASYVASIKGELTGKVVLQTSNYALAMYLNAVKGAKIYRIMMDDKDARLPEADPHYYRVITDISDD